ncbi:hypothetical protein F5972_30075 [Microbispora cellulosiformans]|uniref:MazG nucleotide pyrophosphohydrolase n=1 Tax=Microbispora cellulosiformans TaxID=2614688 RepID=A0A5J5JU27_9ACTN|nr:hypothetical protein [Microbispora cellulosiformans]KAA9374851.1 hypothetical protein F5972_30075 [Microbispora cellulosiformans]
MAKPSVSIIGSFRKHYAEILSAVKEFEAVGMIVNSPAVSRIVNPGEEYVRFESDPPHSLDHHIQSITLEKILASDFVYVVAPGGYVGRTTCYELGRVHERGVSVYFSEPVRDLPIEILPGAVLQPAVLASMMLRLYGA